VSGRVPSWARIGLLLAIASAPAIAADLGCDAYVARPVQTGRTARVLPELSGLAASRRHRGIFWAHNDSGHGFVIHAMRQDGTVAASFPVLGVTPHDPEDLALGPCAPADARQCLYVADTGDNFRTRSHVQIIRVVEPVELRSGPLIGDAFPFTYPDGSHDAEAVLVDPRTADVYVVTKALMSLGDVYRVDVHGRPRRETAAHVATLSAPTGFDSLVTAGSVHPSGTRVLLRTYAGLWEYARADARSLADVVRTTPRDVPTARHLQGEAVAYTADGRGYLLGGEGGATALFRVDCRPPEPARPKPVAR
jgi:hypothetical protein